MEPTPQKNVLVKDIMTDEVVTASPDMSLLDVAKIIAEHNFNGLPVIDENHKIVGIITEFDLIEKASEATINTLHEVLNDVYASKDADTRLKGRAKEIYPLKASDIMTKETVTIHPEATFEELIELFRGNPKINPIPVVDGSDKLVGLVSRSDILRPLSFYQFREGNK